jgi:hypothetical protein
VNRRASLNTLFEFGLDAAERFIEETAPDFLSSDGGG